MPDRLKTFDDGFNLADKLVKKWNAQPKPPKVYVGGYRIHHGLVGLCLGAAGLIFDHKPAIGAGLRLIADDIADHHDWFNFQK